MTSLFFFYRISKDDLRYIGKTADPKSRVSTHKCKSKTSDIPLYQTIRANGGWDNFKFEVIETKHLSKDEARQHERNLYDLHNANMNTCTPNGRPQSVAYYERNAGRLRVQARERYKKTKTEWKYPKKTKEQTKALHLKKIANTGKTPTALTCQKYEITQEEIQEATQKFQAK